MKNILFLVFLFYSMGGAFQLQAIPNDIDFAPLTRIVGLPFYEPKTSITIHDQNKKGDAVGGAYFKGAEIVQVLWYWNFKTGFHIIASSLNVPRAKKEDFQFYTACINDRGVVACSYLDGAYIKQKQECDYQYAWIWWSKEEGLHVTPPTKEYRLVKDLNNHDYIFINGIERKTATLINIHDMHECRVFDIGAKIRQAIQSWAIEKGKQLYWRNPEKARCNYNFLCWAIEGEENLTDEFKLQGKIEIDNVHLYSSKPRNFLLFKLTVGFVIDTKGNPRNGTACVEKEVRKR